MREKKGHRGIIGSYLLRLVKLTERWGVSSRDLFEGLSLRPEDLEDPSMIVPPTIGIELVERVRRLTREPALGFHFGLETSISAHGYLSFAAMSSSTLGQALELSIRYSLIRTSALSLRLTVKGDRAVLDAEEREDLGSARDVFLLGMLVGTWQIGNALLGRVVPESTVHLTLREPAWYQRFRDVDPRVRFGQAANQLSSTQLC